MGYNISPTRKCFWGGSVDSSLSHEKMQTNCYFPLCWLVNRDPHNGHNYNPHITGYRHIPPPFFIAHMITETETKKALWLQGFMEINSIIIILYQFTYYTCVILSVCLINEESNKVFCIYIHGRQTTQMLQFKQKNNTWSY